MPLPGDMPHGLGPPDQVQSRCHDIVWAAALMCGGQDSQGEAIALGLAIAVMTLKPL